LPSPITSHRWSQHHRSRHR